MYVTSVIPLDFSAAENVYFLQIDMIWSLEIPSMNFSEFSFFAVKIYTNTFFWIFDFYTFEFKGITLYVTYLNMWTRFQVLHAVGALYFY